MDLFISIIFRFQLSSVFRALFELLFKQFFSHILNMNFLKCEWNEKIKSPWIWTDDDNNIRFYYLFTIDKNIQFFQEQNQRDTLVARYIFGTSY